MPPRNATSQEVKEVEMRLQSADYARPASDDGRAYLNRTGHLIGRDDAFVLSDIALSLRQLVIIADDIRRRL